MCLLVTHTKVVVVIIVILETLGPSQGPPVSTLLGLPPPLRMGYSLGGSNAHFIRLLPTSLLSSLNEFLSRSPILLSSL